MVCDKILVYGCTTFFHCLQGVKYPKYSWKIKRKWSGLLIIIFIKQVYAHALVMIRQRKCYAIIRSCPSFDVMGKQLLTLVLILVLKLSEFGWFFYQWRKRRKVSVLTELATKLSNFCSMWHRCHTYCAMTKTIEILKFFSCFF